MCYIKIGSSFCKLSFHLHIMSWNIKFWHRTFVPSSNMSQEQKHRHKVFSASNYDLRENVSRGIITQKMKLHISIFQPDQSSRHIPTAFPWQPGPRFNIKMTSYQYRNSNCGDKTIWRPSYLHNGISCTDKITSLYWIGDQVVQPGADLIWPCYYRTAHLTELNHIAQATTAYFHLSQWIRLHLSIIYAKHVQDKCIWKMLLSGLWYMLPIYLHKHYGIKFTGMDHTCLAEMIFKPCLQGG